MTTVNSAPVSITLTTSNLAQGWQQGKTLQITDDNITIYLPQDNGLSLTQTSKGSA